MIPYKNFDYSNLESFVTSSVCFKFGLDRSTGWPFSVRESGLQCSLQRQLVCSARESSYHKGLLQSISRASPGAPSTEALLGNKSLLAMQPDHTKPLNNTELIRIRSLGFVRIEKGCLWKQDGWFFEFVPLEVASRGCMNTLMNATNDSSWIR